LPREAAQTHYLHGPSPGSFLLTARIGGAEAIIFVKKTFAFAENTVTKAPAG
jgi:hypothetical protein